MRGLLAIATVVSAVALAAPAEAKPYTYSDAKGDMPANAGLDIVGVRYSTEGVTTARKVGRRTVRTYEPTKLVATLTLAGAAVDQPGVRYRVDAQVSECGNLTFSYARPANELLASSMLAVGCGGAPGTTGGDTLFLDPKFSLSGNKLTWTIPLKAMPKQARAGGLLFGLNASVDVVDPVLGALGPDDAGNALLDTASSDADWEIG